MHEKSPGNAAPLLEIAKTRVLSTQATYCIIRCTRCIVKSGFQLDADGLEAPSNKSTSSAEASQFSTNQLVQLEFSYVLEPRLSGCQVLSGAVRRLSSCQVSGGCQACVRWLSSLSGCEDARTAVRLSGDCQVVRLSGCQVLSGAVRLSGCQVVRCCACACMFEIYQIILSHLSTTRPHYITSQNTNIWRVASGCARASCYCGELLRGCGEPLRGCGELLRGQSY